MTHATPLWSIWLALVRPFHWAFTRPGHRRFVEWVTALAIDLEEHTVSSPGNEAGGAAIGPAPSMDRKCFAESRLDATGRAPADTGGNGGGGIRTHGRCDPSTVFKTAPIDPSGTPPCPTPTSLGSPAHLPEGLLGHEARDDDGGSHAA